jgi:gas vesicle protein GvpL/GvpF
MTTSSTEATGGRLARARRSGIGATATYVYCAVQASGTPGIARMPSGLPGLGKPRLLDAGDGLWIVVGDAPLPQYGEASIARGLADLDWVSRCAIAHESVVERWIRAQAVVPMKLFTIFENDERALAYVRQQRRRLDRIIRRVAGRCEWGVRIRLASPRAPERRVRRATSGAGYLAAKKQVRDAAHDQAIRGQSRANAVFAALASKAAEAERHSPPAGGRVPSRLLLDAAFLVDTGQVEPFRAVTRRLTRELKGEGFSLELTGPWPPYNFIES